MNKLKWRDIGNQTLVGTGALPSGAEFEIALVAVEPKAPDEATPDGEPRFWKAEPMGREQPGDRPRWKNPPYDEKFSTLEEAATAAQSEFERVINLDEEHQAHRESTEREIADFLSRVNNGDTA